MSFEEDREVFPFPGKGKSTVWEHFGFYKTKYGDLDKSKAICKWCRRGVSYSGNTTNLRAHVLHNHRGEDGLDEKLLMSRGFTGVPSSSPSGSESQGLDQDRTRLKAFGNCSSDFNSQTTSIVTKACLNFVVGELLPLEVLESKTFRDLIGFCGGRKFDIPSVDEVNGMLMSNYYFGRQKVSEYLSKAESEYMKIETWNIGSSHYMTISVQALSDNWKTNCFVLDTYDLGGSYTGKRVSDYIYKTIQEWSLTEEITILSNDSPEVRAAVKKLVGEHVVSLEVSIDNAASLLVEQATASNIIKHVRNIAELFKNNAIARAVLQDKQKILKLELNSLELCEVGNWKSVLEMLESFSELSPALMACFSDPNLITDTKVKMLTAKETSLVHCIIGLLKPLKKGYSLSHNMKCPSMSVILPVLKKLEVELSSSDCDSQVLAEVKTKMLEQLSQQYANKSHRDLLLLCSLLDPRFKDLKFVTQLEQEAAYDLLKQSAADVSNMLQSSTDAVFADSPQDCCIKIEVNDDHEFSPCSGEDATAVSMLVDQINQISRNKKRRLSSKKGSPLQPDPMNDWLADVVQDSVMEEKQEDPISNEIARYKAELQILSTSSPLSWWRDRSKTYPILSHVAKKYACAPAILSDTTEKKRNLFERQRGCLSESNLEMMLFLNANLDLTT